MRDHVKASGWTHGVRLDPPDLHRHIHPRPGPANPGPSVTLSSIRY
ncbi:hypothetical protein FOPG_11407 [Fusarium oxysporum f. sp. conglutinans race 2 54008]|uniref:Uncharacterized protein n=1 Tax=Fusarium oxysporum f. sp. conglutinans race 2 54008 TaxID=1089457 RepID=X0IJ54_FUSOX|nr:hypothetical protein FOPG_11407 [Fusarium oxysporum f. sp. conglutinans race 2 54008]